MKKNLRLGLGVLGVLGVGALIAAAACTGKPSGDAPSKDDAAATKDKAAPAGPAAPVAPTPTQDPLTGPPAPALLLSQAWFYKDAAGNPKPGPARLDIWRQTAEGWTRTRLEDPDSNVFHKAIPYEGGILTIGAEKANLKLWHFQDGAWKADTLWTRQWEGKFNRLRDLEIGDVDGDGKLEFVVATHDAGVVAVVNPAEGDDGRPEVIEMDLKPDTFVHEIEIADLDGDGKLEFFATPTDRNKANSSQGGMMVMYHWNGTIYERSVVDPMGNTHAKEILAADITGDGQAELFSVLEAETNELKQVTKPVEIRQYTKGADGFTYKTIATIDDRQTRFLVPGDFDGDGKQELIACAMTTGIWHLSPPAADAPVGTMWTTTRFEQTSSGFEHSCYPADLNGDGKLELYVASDDQRELRRYTWDATSKTFNRELLSRLDPDTITWNITSGTL